VLLRAQGKARDGDEPISPLRCDLLGSAQFTPAVGEPLDARDLVALVGLEQALEPGVSHRGVRGCARDDLHEFRSGEVDSSADCARRAVHVFERRREPLEERDCTLGGECRLASRCLPELGDRLPDTRDRRL
jgi:hypothetical protein